MAPGPVPPPSANPDPSAARDPFPDPVNNLLCPRDALAGRGLPWPQDSWGVKAHGSSPHAHLSVGVVHHCDAVAVAPGPSTAVLFADVKIQRARSMIRQT